MKQICILGDGAWGTAIAMLLADNGYRVVLWCYEAEVVQAITQSGTNEKYLPGFHINTSLVRPTNDMREAICSSEWIFQAIPVTYLRSVIEKAALYATPEQTWVLLSKGIEQDTLLLPGQLIDDISGYHVHKAIVSGPSFAKNVASRQITAVSIASDNSKIAHTVAKMMANDYFCPTISTDMIGTQVGGALKNGIALGVGILNGAGYSDNVKAFFLTHGLHEMVALATSLGGKRDTLYDLAGVGDLVLTAMGESSRNTAFGKRLGAGESFEDLKKQVPVLPEGVNTLLAVHQLATKRGISLPLFTALYDVVFKGKSLQQLVTVLMQTPLMKDYELKR